MARSKSATTAVITDTPLPRPRKINAVVELLRRDNGATLGEISAATGWQAHYARAVLTGLRKNGQVLEKSKRVEVTRYRIAKPA